jgi:hypothetical protein
MPNNHVHSIFFFTNGMVAVYDDQGNQIPEVQGSWARKYVTYVAACPDLLVDDETTIHLAGEELSGRDSAYLRNEIGQQELKNA